MGNAPPRRRLAGDGAFRRAASDDVRLHDWEWERFAKSYRQRHPLCVDCLAAGITEAAAEVHHKRKLRDYPELKYDEDNLMSLCSTCHGVRTARGE